jgi:heat shock protein HtpX
MVELYDQISRNKRNSLILMFGMFVLVVLTVAAFSYLLDFGDFGFILAILISIVYVLVGYYWSADIVIAMSGAKEAGKQEYPYLYNTVEGLSLAAGIPKPKVYVVNDPAPNAFATGRDPQHSIVAVTTGLLDMMNRQELEGVLAHELSHIKNYDVRFMTFAVVMVGLIAILGDIALRMLFFGGGRDERKGGGALMLIGLVFIILAPIFGTLVRFAISRKREFLADADGALLTRYPEGLASALEKIGKANMKVKNANDTTASLYISDPLGKRAMNLFASHPPLGERIAALRRM